MHLGGSPWISIAVGIFLTGTYGLIRSVSSALGEEIGWRGFLVPELSKATSFTLTSLISGIVWSLWHYPILIYGDYNAGTPTWYGLTCFTYIDEFGCVLPLVVLVFAVYFWSKRRELPV